MIRLAIVGDGDFAAYARIRARLPHVLFTGVAIPDAARAAAVAESLGASVIVPDVERLLLGHSATFDALLVHGPSRKHVDVALAAAINRKHLLVAPPISFVLREADRIIDVCRENKVRLMAGATERFLPSVRAMRTALESGKLGAPGLLRIHRWWPRRPPGRSSHLWQTAAREIDLALWTFGGLPDVVFATGRTKAPDAAAASASTSGEANSTVSAPRGDGDDASAPRSVELAPTPAMAWSSPVEEYVQIHLGFAGGGMALIDCAETLPAGAGYVSRSLIGSSGATYADDHHDMQLMFRGGDPAALRTDGEPLDTLAMLREFVDAIEARREPSVTGTDGRAAVEIAHAASQSLRSGTTHRRTGGRYEPA